MKVKNLCNLNDLEDEVSSIRQLIKDRHKHKYQVPSKPLFRGQSNADWELETTLERYHSSEFTVSRYNTTLWAIAPAVSAFTEKDWVVADEFNDDEKYFTVPPNYEFMAYVRHHGFPSPLLDWSQSLYVALFFAYKNAKPDNDVAIFVYIESLSCGKSGWVGAPQIFELGPYAKTHRRHFAQQGQYTVAVKKDGRSWEYCPHKLGFEESKGLDQDVLYKLTLPGGLRNSILAKLHEMNINAYTLYASEESLMDMLAYKEIALRNL